MGSGPNFSHKIKNGLSKVKEDGSAFVSQTFQNFGSAHYFTYGLNLMMFLGWLVMAMIAASKVIKSTEGSAQDFYSYMEIEEEHKNFFTSTTHVPSLSSVITIVFYFIQYIFLFVVLFTTDKKIHHFTMLQDPLLALVFALIAASVGTWVHNRPDVTFGLILSALMVHVLVYIRWQRFIWRSETAPGLPSPIEYFVGILPSSMMLAHLIWETMRISLAYYKNASLLDGKFGEDWFYITVSSIVALVLISFCFLLPGIYKGLNELSGGSFGKSMPDVKKLVIMDGVVFGILAVEYFSNSFSAREYDSTSFIWYTALIFAFVHAIASIGIIIISVNNYILNYDGDLFRPIVISEGTHGSSKSVSMTF